jgi:hypothetical protein
LTTSMGRPACLVGAAAASDEYPAAAAHGHRGSLRG